MEPESPSPFPQVPATCPYPEPTPSSPHDGPTCDTCTKQSFYKISNMETLLMFEIIFQKLHPYTEAAGGRTCKWPALHEVHTKEQ